jgi:ribosomal-protein-alanine N-acetyltransferase
LAFGFSTGENTDVFLRENVCGVIVKSGSAGRQMLAQRFSAGWAKITNPSASGTTEFDRCMFECEMNLDQRPVLETERLMLRYLTANDVEAVFAVIGDPDTMKFYPQKFSRGDATGWITRSLERYRRDGYGLFAVVLKSTGEFVGTCGLMRQDVEGESMLEVGYHLHRDRWGHGYATEAARGCMDYAFGYLMAEKVVSLILPENVPSRRVAERNGMRVEREVMFHALRHLLYALNKCDCPGT